MFHRKTELIRGFDDVFHIPHSRYTGLNNDEVKRCKELTVLAESEETGPSILIAQGGKQIFVMGHPEYDRNTLRKNTEEILKKDWK